MVSKCFSDIKGTLTISKKTEIRPGTKEEP